MPNITNKWIPIVFYFISSCTLQEETSCLGPYFNKYRYQAHLGIWPIKCAIKKMRLWLAWPILRNLSALVKNAKIAFLAFCSPCQAPAGSFCYIFGVEIVSRLRNTLHNSRSSTSWTSNPNCTGRSAWLHPVQCYFPGSTGGRRGLASKPALPSICYYI